MAATIGSAPRQHGSWWSLSRILPAAGPGVLARDDHAAGSRLVRGMEAGLNALLAAEAGAAAKPSSTLRLHVGHDRVPAPVSKGIEGLVPTAPASPVHPNAAAWPNSAQRCWAASPKNRVCAQSRCD